MGLNAYNGWSNRETWLVNLWFEPQKASDLDAIKEKIQDDVAAMPDYLRDFLDVDIIDWDELAAHLEEEVVS